MIDKGINVLTSIKNPRTTNARKKPWSKAWHRPRLQLQLQPAFLHWIRENAFSLTTFGRNPSTAGYYNCTLLHAHFGVWSVVPVTVCVSLFLM
jgi:hypothetical protein